MAVYFSLIDLDANSFTLPSTLRIIFIFMWAAFKVTFYSLYMGPLQRQSIVAFREHWLSDSDHTEVRFCFLWSEPPPILNQPLNIISLQFHTVQVIASYVQTIKQPSPHLLISTIWNFDFAFGSLFYQGIRMWTGSDDHLRFLILFVIYLLLCNEPLWRGSR